MCSISLHIKNLDILMKKYHFNHRRNKNHSNRWLFFWVLLIFIIIIPIMVLQVYRFSSAFRYWQQNRKLKQEYTKEINRLYSEQIKLKKEVYNLNHNKLVQERLAREIGFIKSGEIVYRFSTNENETK